MIAASIALAVVALALCAVTYRLGLASLAHLAAERDERTKRLSMQLGAQRATDIAALEKRIEEAEKLARAASLKGLGR